MGAGVVLNRKKPDKGLSEADCHRPCRRHNSVDGNVVRLRRNYLGLQYLVDRVHSSQNRLEAGPHNCIVVHHQNLCHLFLPVSRVGSAGHVCCEAAERNSEARAQTDARFGLRIDCEGGAQRVRTFLHAC